MSSIFAGTERTTPPQSQASKPPLGPVLIALGVALCVFGLLLTPLISADVRSGHRFWLRIIVADELSALALIGAGCVKNYLGGTRQS
jgi:hypothetical protein